MINSNLALSKFSICYGPSFPPFFCATNAVVLLDRRQTGSPKKGYKSPSSSPGTFGGPKTTLADLEVEKLVDLLVFLMPGDGYIL